MNEAQLTHFRRIPEAWCNRLRDEVDRTVTYIQDEAINFPSPVDCAAQEEEFGPKPRNRDRERKLIKKIGRTLKKVEGEDFDYCESCGAEISTRRLEVHLIAGLCVGCKTLAEIREKQMAGQLQSFHHIYHRREMLPPYFLPRKMTDVHYVGRFVFSLSDEFHFGSLIAALGNYLQTCTR